VDSGHTTIGNLPAAIVFCFGMQRSL